MAFSRMLDTGQNRPIPLVTHANQQGFQQPPPTGSGCASSLAGPVEARRLSLSKPSPPSARGLLRSQRTSAVSLRDGAFPVEAISTSVGRLLRSQRTLTRNDTRLPSKQSPHQPGDCFARKERSLAMTPRADTYPCRGTRGSAPTVCRSPAAGRRNKDGWFFLRKPCGGAKLCFDSQHNRAIMMDSGF